MASTVEHGSGQQTRGPNPSLPTSIRHLERFGRKRTVESAKGCPKSPNLDSGPPRLPPKPRLALTADYRIHLDASRRRSNRFGLDNTMLNRYLRRQTGLTSCCPFAGFSMR